MTFREEWDAVFFTGAAAWETGGVGKFVCFLIIVDLQYHIRFRCTAVIQYLYALQNVHHSKSNYHLSPHSYYIIFYYNPYAVFYIS